MAADKSKEARTTDRVPVSYLIKLDCPTKDEFEKVYALNLSRGGMFIHSHHPQPLGTTVQFEVRVADGTQVLRGQGVVKWVRSPSSGQSEINPGMGIQFTSLDGEGGRIIDRIIAARGKTTHACGDLVAAGVREGDAGPEQQAAVGERAAPHAAAGRHDKVIGIDLGTTYSCVATVINGRPMVIPSRQGYRTLPSVVAINEKGKLLVGHPAREQILINPRDTVYGAKRLIGRKFDSPIVADIKSRYAYEITEGKNGEAAVSIAGHQFSLQEISALILTELREIAQIFLGTEVRRAVITVPAFYNEAQRQAVREAGALAELEVERIVSEPTAAALAFGFGRRLDKRLMIYDLGGGTFDVSVLDVHGDVFEVVSTGGDTFLGGGDFDNRLVDLLADGFLSEHGVDLRTEKVVHQRVLFAAENAKCRLSEQESVRIHVPFVAMNGGAPLDLLREVSRSELESATSDLVDRTVITCDDVLNARAVPPETISEILLVGGQSRMPLIWRKIRENFSREPHKGVHPDEAVACGAALLADSLARSDSLLLVDVLPMSIGIRLPNGKYSRVVPRNTPLPTGRNFTISTSSDRQTSLSLPFYQGESDLLEANECLGILKINEMPSRPRGQTRCRVDLTVTQESLLQIKVSDMPSGMPLNARFDGTSSHRQALNVEVFGDEPVLSGMVQTGVIPARGPEGGRRGVFGRFWSWLTRR